MIVATAEKYKEALIDFKNGMNGGFIGSAYHKMLKAQYHASNHKITATRLAEAAGYTDFSAANLHYGIMAHAIADFLGYKPPKRKYGDRERMWHLSLSMSNDASGDTIDGHFEFEMRPEVVAALESLTGWV